MSEQLTHTVAEGEPAYLLTEARTVQVSSICIPHANVAEYLTNVSSLFPAHSQNLHYVNIKYNLCKQPIHSYSNVGVGESPSVEDSAALTCALPSFSPL